MDLVIASVDDYEIEAGLCGSDGAEEIGTYTLKLIFLGHPIVTIPDLDRNRDVVAGFGEKLKGNNVDPDDLLILVDDYLGEVYGLSF